MRSFSCAFTARSDFGDTSCAKVSHPTYWQIRIVQFLDWAILPTQSTRDYALDSSDAERVSVGSIILQRNCIVVYSSWEQG